jgi:hypothetical protein
MRPSEDTIYTGLDDLAGILCACREAFGYCDLARDLGCSVEDARQLVEADWRATDSDDMYVQVLDRGTARLAAQLDTTPDAIDAFIDSRIC